MVLKGLFLSSEVINERPAQNLFFPFQVDCCEFYLSPGKYNMTRPAICWPMPVPQDDPFYNTAVGKNPPKLELLAYIHFLFETNFRTFKITNHILENVFHFLQSYILFNYHDQKQNLVVLLSRYFSNTYL